MKERLKAIFAYIFVYIIAAAAALGIYFIMTTYVGDPKATMNWGQELAYVLLADFTAMVFVFIAGYIFDSPSLYDPFWSLQTVVIMALLLSKYQAWNLGSIIFFVIISLWAARLTFNFFYGLKNLQYVDWRYVSLKEKSGKLFWLTNFLGIHLFPTLVVYTASIPAMMFAISGYNFNWFQLIGLVIMALAIALETISDINMKKFIKTRKDNTEIIRTGLWKYSRHPNYLGEILFWFGLALVYILPSFAGWYWIGGAIVNLLMFLFISIPMAENHMMTYKVGFKQYRRETWMLLPFKKNVKEK